MSQDTAYIISFRGICVAENKASLKNPLRTDANRAKINPTKEVISAAYGFLAATMQTAIKELKKKQ